MENELIANRSWWKRNRNWFLPFIIVLIILGIGSTITASEDSNLSDITQAYLDKSLYENALEKVKQNQIATETLGEIESIDKLAIVEGNTRFSDNNTSVETTIRIKGNKAKGKMDIFAKRKGTEWEYKKIIIRIKKPQQVITILK